MAGEQAPDARRQRANTDPGGRRVALLATSIVEVGVLFALVAGLTSAWQPVSDWALIELGVRDVGTASTPLVGAYSRFGWNHPGPWGLYVLALPYRAFGGSAPALLGATAVVHGVAVAGIAWASWRRGGERLVVASMLAVAVLVRSLGLGFLIDPWNPYVPVLLALWFLIEAWNVACGSRWAIPIALGLGTVCVQSHAGYLPLIVLVSLTSAVLLVVFPGRSPDRSIPSRVRTTDEPGWPKVMAVVAIVVVAGWLPVAVDQMTSDQGNAGRLISYVADHRPGASPTPNAPAGAPQPVGATGAAGILAAESVVPAPWLTGFEPLGAFRTVQPAPAALVLVPVALAASVGALGWCRRRYDVVAGVLVAVAAIVATWLALSQIVGPAVVWLVRPAWAASSFFAAILVWGVWVCLDTRGVRSTRRVPAKVAVGACALAGLLVVATIVPVGSVAPPKDEFGQNMERVAVAVSTWLHQNHKQSVLVLGDPALVFFGQGLLAALDRDGFEVLVQDGVASVLVRGHGLGGVRPDATLRVAEGADRSEYWQAKEPDRVVVALDPTPTQARAGIPPVAVTVV